MQLQINVTINVFSSALTDPERIGVLLSSSIFEAHTRTILLTYDQIRERWRAGVDQQKVFMFKNMVSNFLYVLVKVICCFSNIH